MSVIYLKHPMHGTKVAVLEAEAVADEEKGWERFSLDAKVEITDPKELPPGAVVVTSERDSLVTKYAEKFGKKPHHKKSVETLRAEIGDAA